MGKGLDISLRPGGADSSATNTTFGALFIDRDDNYPTVETIP